MNETRFDAVIIGAGPAGGAAALLLARSGWKVAVIERKSFPRRKVCGEYLSSTNRPLFKLLGIDDEFDALAGPEVTHVGLFANDRILTSPLPRLHGSDAGWGRALSRERLDSLLLEKARAAGACLLQPVAAESLNVDRDGFRCTIRRLNDRATSELSSKVVVLAHGSWEQGKLPSQRKVEAHRPGDLLAFKAHFAEGSLPAGLMPLLAFPGGYGGMVHADQGRFSVSCCIRRDQLALIRREHPGLDAGVAVERYLASRLRGVREALRGASRIGDWLAAGPIRPGVRLNWQPGLYSIGNAAGEAHPVIAEGISIAMQSAWLLVRELVAVATDRESLRGAGERYSSRWRRAFVPRLRASAAIARWAMSPLALCGTLPFVRLFPSLLTVGARLSGKVHRVVGHESPIASSQ